MRRIQRQFLLLVLFFFALVPKAAADEILGAWSPRQVPGVTEEALRAAARLGTEEIAKKNLTVERWPEALLLLAGANRHRGDRALLEALIAQLADGTKAELKETQGLIIWERIAAGDLPFQGFGYQVSDDLFTVAGRANWMLRNLTEKNFGQVRRGATDADLAALRQRWLRWLRGEQVEEFRSEYVLKGPAGRLLKGSVTGPETVEALIVSLRPNRAKVERREKCLELERGLSGLPPTAPHSSTAFEMCDPDLLSRTYLAALTGVREKRNHEWWLKWWERNRERMSWNGEKGMFVVPK